MDYGSGNIRSAARACESTGREVIVTSNPLIAQEAEGLVVPGVGAFAACMEGLKKVGGDGIVRERLAHQRPVLGICVGMQILFSGGIEHGRHEGADLIEGEVSKLDAPVLPHMGWNTVEVGEGSQLFKGVEDESFYFVHSYAAKSAKDGIATWSTYGERFLAAIELGALSATQFHPEKSGKAGLALIKNWAATL